MESTLRKRKMYEEFLGTVPLLGNKIDTLHVFTFIDIKNRYVYGPV